MTITNDSVVLVNADVSAGTPLKDESGLTGSLLKIYRGDIIRWVCTAGVAADRATLTDPKGGIIFDSVTQNANNVDWMYAPKDYLAGVLLTALAHGTLYIFRASGRIT